MYTYKFSDDEELLDKTSEKEKIFEKLKEIDDKYSYATNSNISNDDINFEKKSYEAPNENEIEEMAKQSLSSYKDSSLKKIDEDFNKNSNKLKEKIENAVENKDEEFSDTINSYNKSVKNFTNKAIKNGITNSSIFDEALKEIENEKNLKLGEAEEKFGGEIRKLQSEMSILESQKDSALSSFDISYALKLNDEINKISSEIAKKQDEVLKYNNQIEEKANKLKLEREKEIARQNENLTKLLSEKGLVEVNKMKQKEKYEIVKDYLSSMSKADALRELEDKNYQKELSVYYPSLFAEIYSRDE